MYECEHLKPDGTPDCDKCEQYECCCHPVHEFFDLLEEVLDEGEEDEAH